ncbi:MAG: bifunctional precorrin-2 dehydrogenase/sirohydrochlorin ferrochelatase [Bacteroidales bacterium]|nr:bifunctional precorrin-2 dehydrogenase/sirohydrochlorin ferrochelatase [Bacteroidales bacterium]
MDFLPINIRINGANILIVGGGKVATHKAEILSRYTQHATIVASSVSEGIKRLPFRIIERDFAESDLDNVNLLFVCTGNHVLNRRIKELARQRGVLASVCDAPELCDFTSPAIYQHGNITIAVASDAKNVKRSIAVRNQIKSAIENDIIQIN